jgi:hypothetical protein
VEEFKPYDPGELPVMPDWSPVKIFPGYWKKEYTAHLSHQHHHASCACHVPPTQSKVRHNPFNIPQWMLGPRGLLDGGCECFAF